MIEYKGLPLFGDDSNPRNTSKFFGILGTFIVWFIFLICMIIIRPAEKEQRKYKDVQIVFEALPPLPEPPPPPEPIIEEPEPEPVVKIEEAVIETPEVEIVEQKQEKTVENKPKPVIKQPEKQKELSKKDNDKKPVPKKEPIKQPVKKPEEQVINDSKKEGVKLQQDMTNPVFPDKNKEKVPKKEINWDELFPDDNSVVESSQPKPNVKVETKNELKGTAAEGITPNQQKNSGAIKSQESEKPSGNTSVSDKTKGALSGIRNVVVKGDGGRSEITFKGGSEDGGFFMSMGGGNSDTGLRGLISPKEPTIKLSPEAISEIDVSKSVNVSFTVLPDGNVVEVFIDKESSLPPSVAREIKEQVSSWRFMSSIFKSQGEFRYNIKVN